ncbi:VOC family protein [Cellvibrio zantedeschiae]|uniref:VOC family protein n=1 Tax=Cellvibrio zantedeschiae TaxID=1237077 RepID=A0ABQ3ATB6_9GAMM|nr:VOC family protein [Cellvibrio zantedeschiae]GGY65265.1 VOC family protein [Cellvibrio zantedeschiae]
MQKITPFLWFNDNALEAAEFYASIFKNSAITNVTHVGQTDRVMSVSFELEGQAFHALNGGPHFTFTPAISLFVDCKDQAEVDDLWERLSADGEKSRCGWLKDKFGLSWQIIPTQMSQLLRDSDPAKAQAVMNAMMQMSKIDIAVLQQAYNKI